MSKQVADKQYLTTEEVREKLGWSRDSLYRFYRRGLLNPQKFLGDKKTFWEAAQLETLQLKVVEKGRSAAGGPSNAQDSRLNGESEPEKREPAEVRGSRAGGPRTSPGNDLEILQVWLKNNSALSDPEKRAIWAIAAKDRTPPPDFEVLAPQEPDFTDKLLADWKRERPEIDENLFALFGRLQRAGRSFDRDVEQALTAHGLKVSEFLVLAALRRRGPPFSLTPTELFKSLLITSGTITKRIVRLENRHLVERRPDPEDGRGTRVYLTPAGKALVDDAIASPGEEPYKWLQKILTPLERQLFERILRKMLRERESNY